MNPIEFSKMLEKYHKSTEWPHWPPPEAKFVTGTPKIDAFLHHMITEHGVDIKLNTKGFIGDYNIINEQKFSWFLLKWL